WGPRTGGERLREQRAGGAGVAVSPPTHNQFSGGGGGWATHPSRVDRAAPLEGSPGCPSFSNGLARRGRGALRAPVPSTEAPGRGPVAHLEARAVQVGHQLCKAPG